MGAVLYCCTDLGPRDRPTRLELLIVKSEPAGRVCLHYRIMSTAGEDPARRVGRRST